MRPQTVSKVKDELRFQMSFPAYPSPSSQSEFLQVYLLTYCNLLINELCSAINHRLTKYESNALYVTGAVLDPRFRLQWCQLNEIEDIKASIVYARCRIFTKPVAYASTKSNASSMMMHSIIYHLDE